MKNIILTTIVCFIALSCNTLKLAVCETAPDGSQVYASTDVTLLVDETDDIYTALGMKAGGGKDSLFAISVTSQKKSDEALFKKGEKMVITLSDGSEIVLKNICDSYYAVENEFYLSSQPVSGVAYNVYASPYYPWYGFIGAPYQFTGYVPSPDIKKNTYSYALYLVSCEQIHAIMEKGTTSLVIGSGERKFQMKHPENASELYSQLYSFLKEESQKPHGKK